MNKIDIGGPNEPRHSGKIYLANEGAVSNQFLSEALTQYAVGWKSEEGKLEAVINALCGAPITVSKRFSFKKADNAKAFMAADADEDIRAIGGEFKRIELPGTTVDSHTQSKGLTLRIDRDELNDDPEAEQKAVAYLKTVLLRSEAIRAFALLNAAATNAAKAWGTATPADADADVIEAIIAGADDAGAAPNSVFFGATAFQKRFLTLRASSNASVGNGALLSLDQLAGLYGVEKVNVCSERYEAASGKSTVLSTNLVLCYNATASGMKDDPANIKRFVTRMGGADFGVYRVERPEGVDVTVAHQSRILVSNAKGVRKLTIS